jgi:hypothetical protein
VDRYTTNLLSTYYESQDMASRIDKLHDDFDTMTREDVRKKLDSRDKVLGRAIRVAENSLKKPLRKCPWSPVLRNAGVVGECLQSTDHTARMRRLESQVQQHDPHFRLPQCNEELSIKAIQQNLNKATKSFRKIQKDSSSHRQKTLYDLHSLYESGQSPLPPDENRRRSTAVRNTIRNLYANIR